MLTLPFKLVVTPTLIAAVSLAGRRWGQGVSGWIIGLPLSSGPIAFFLALEEGPRFAMGTALGALAGTIGEAIFCLVYAWLARERAWPLALAGASLAFAVAGSTLQYLTPPLPVLAAAAPGTVLLALVLMPPRAAAVPSSALPRWDLPGRMAAATLLVLLLTGAAPILGPRLTGLLSTFPIFGSILTVFAHHLEGSGAATRVLHGLLLGLFAFSAFFLVIAALLERVGIVPGFLMATAAALAIQASSLRLVRR